MKLICLTLVILLAGCACLHKNATETKVEDVVEVPEPSGPQIIFLSYQLSIDEEKQISAELLSKKIKDGKLKQSRSRNKDGKEGDLQCIQLDENGHALETEQIANPLIKDVEYVGPDGNLGRKIVELDKADLSIRMQLDPRARSISLQLMNGSNQILSNIAL